MKSAIIAISLVLFVFPSALIAQRRDGDANPFVEEKPSGEGSTSAISLSSNTPAEISRPFMFAATAESASSLGGQFQFATNLTSRINLRDSYNVLLWKTWISNQGLPGRTTVMMTSSKMSLDFYPFPNHGIYFSPGLLIHNPQVAVADVPLAPAQGGLFTANGHTYYTPPVATTYVTGVNPIDVGRAMAHETVNLPRTAFTMTSGWGNMVRHKNGPWTFPVEVGAAFLGSPAVGVASIWGQVCDAQSQNCSVAETNPQLRNDLLARFGKCKSHLDLLKTYPIVSIGVAYNFRVKGKMKGSH